MDKEKLKRLRYRARTDLYWLTTEILGYTDLVPRVHLPVANHFFHLQPGVPIQNVAPAKQKRMSLYDPRGHFKTTLMQASATQWILNYPNIRLFLGAGKLDRASDSLVAIKTQFQTNPKLRRLFPEFCPPAGAEWGTQTEFTLPNRSRVFTDPSVMAFSLDSIKAGPHCDVLFLDDAVHPDNIGTPEQLKNTINRYNFLNPIVEPYGYWHIIGTPYNDSDLYAWLDENDPHMRKFRRAAWEITNPDYVEGQEITENDVTLLFPERYSFEYLNTIRKQDTFLFNSQYLMDPTPRDQATFTEDLLNRHRIPHMHIPKSGRVFQAWDIGFSQKQYSDWSVGVTGVYDTRGNIFVLDIVMGKFSPHQLVSQIVGAAMKWRPSKIGIEEAGGSRLMLPALEMMQKQLQRHFNIEWIPTSPLKKKPERIGSLQPLLKQDKLYFSAAIRPDVWQELMKQFVRFPRYAHDDVPDAISMLLHFRNSIDVVADDTEEEIINSVSFDPFEDSLLGAGLVG